MSAAVVYLAVKATLVANDLLTVAIEKVTPLALQSPTYMAAVELVISAGVPVLAPNYILWSAVPQASNIR